MKSRFLLPLFLLISVFSVKAQDLSKWSIGVFPSIFQYHNSDGNEFFKLKESTVGGDLMVGYALNPSFSLEGHFVGANLDFNPDQAEEPLLATDIFNLNAQLHYNFDNGYLLKEDACLAPLLFAGVGGIYSAEGFGAVIPLGAGLKIRIDDLFDIQLRSSYNLTTLDEYNYLQHMAGFVFHLGEGTPKVKEVDSDGDGIVDSKDECPEVAGIASMNGCPERKDSDNDGITDDMDNCPQEKGTAANNGCPEPKDTDGDGIPDSEDNCPTIAGVAANKGCPARKDSDNDGIYDDVDQCPNEPGVAANNGCPELKDSDADGILDKDDKCPFVAGIAANEGCPELDEETVAVLDEALAGIQFESGRDVLKQSSFVVLDHAVDLLKRHPEYNLMMSGYTDSVGDDAMNLDLSKRRAATARQYLIDRGIAPSRVTSEGYGEINPIATNDTPAGRAKNRRVEFKIAF